MDLNPILHAAIRATGGDPDADEYDVDTLERARFALRAVDAIINDALGYTELASITVTDDSPEGS